MPPDDVAHITPTAQDSCRSCWLAVPGLLWMILFFLVPLLLVLAISFASRGTYGGIVWEFTWANYLDLLHPLYGKILGQSLWCATVTTAICFVLGFPLAYVIARSPARWDLTAAWRRPAGRRMPGRKGVFSPRPAMASRTSASMRPAENSGARTWMSPAMVARESSGDRSRK